MSAEGEPLFGEGDDFFSDRTDVARWFESNISRSVIKAQAASGPSAGARRPEAAFFDRSGFMERFTGEQIQVQVQAQHGAQRPQEKPIFPGGLIPTADGFGWRLPT